MKKCNIAMCVLTLLMISPGCVRKIMQAPQTVPQPTVSVGASTPTTTFVGPPDTKRLESTAFRVGEITNEWGGSIVLGQQVGFTIWQCPGCAPECAFDPECPGYRPVTDSSPLEIASGSRSPFLRLVCRPGEPYKLTGRYVTPTGMAQSISASRPQSLYVGCGPIEKYHQQWEHFHFHFGRCEVVEEHRLRNRLRP